MIDLKEFELSEYKKLNEKYANVVKQMSASLIDKELMRCVLKTILDMNIEKNSDGAQRDIETIRGLVKTTLEVIENE